MNKIEKLSGQIALVTGAASQNGSKIAAGLAGMGVRVAVNDVNPDRVAQVVERIEAAGGTAMAYVADVSKKFSVQAMFNAVEDAWGGLDILVNNARILPSKPVLEMDEWEWRRTLDVNLTGVFVMTQIAGRIMRAGRGGTIVNVQKKVENEVGRAAYLAALAGMQALTGIVEAELRGDKIRVLLAPAEEVLEILTE